MTTKIFLHKTPYTPPLFHKKICALHRRCFYKHPLFTTFLIVFTVDEVCYISNKHQTLNNLAIYQYFYKRDFISLRHFEKKIGALHRKSFSKHPLFTTFSLFLKMSDVCNISSKCWLHNKSAKKLFLHKTPYTPSLFQTKFCALHCRIF